jgi:tetratricopeptide (TPR) repeat protein
VTYISGRSSSLSTSFVLLALLLYATGVRDRRAWLWGGLAPAAYLAAVLTKETCAALPAGLLLWELLIERSRGRELLVRQAGWWALLTCLLGVAIMNRAYFDLLYQIAGARPLLQSIWYQVAGAGYLLSRLVLVQRLSIDPGLGIRPPALLPTALTAALLCMLLFTAIAQRRARPVLAFGLSWFLLETFVPYVLLPRPEVLNERHMYLAGVGIFLAAGALWTELTAHIVYASRARAVAAVSALLLIASTLHRNLDYRSATALWQSTVAISPQSPRAHNNLGICFEANGHDREARKAYATAVALEPRYDSARRNFERVQRRLAAHTEH